tara:strand:- start:36765 stop:38351 length:1587 start_codon:yes stop_codon:yes gene_type:complete
MRIYFVADMFKEQLLGGAESNDSVLIKELQTLNHDVKKIRSHYLCEEHLSDKNAVFIIGNFINLSQANKNKLKNKKYIIYEHDHKYLLTRNPSVFKDFVAPKDQIINKSFYENAIGVVVLSKICKEIIEKNLYLTNVYNIGCSLWSEKKLNFIESLLGTPKNEKFLILNSKNFIKGTPEAISFCKNKNIEHDIVEPCLEKELLRTVASYKGYVFFPKVLETFSRLAIEAKMLNCKLITKPKLLGASSEDLFELSGRPLIREVRRRNREAISLFDSLLKSPQKIEDITVILNCYRRPQYLKEQIEAIKRQSLKPKQIWLWVNHHSDNEKIDFSQFEVNRVIKNDYNWKFYGRFALGLLADTTYIAMFDDDTIPGTRWFENCLSVIKKNEGILGGAGVRIKDGIYRGHERFGWSSQNEKTVEVDLVGHAWFFKQEWLKYMWMEKPPTWENGEDIHFSYCSQKYGNINTYCPPHPQNSLALHSSLKGYELGVDEKATSHVRNHFLFYKQRDSCVKNAIKNGWTTVYGRQNV